MKQLDALGAQVGRLLKKHQNSPGFKQEKLKENAYRRHLGCHFCGKEIRSAPEFGGAKPASFSYDNKTSLREIQRRIVNMGWKYFHWLCIYRDPDILLLEKIYGREGRRDWKNADLFRGRIDGFPFSISMHHHNGWKYSVAIGDCVVPGYETARRSNKRNFMADLTLKPEQWSGFVRRVSRLKKSEHPFWIPINATSGICVTQNVLPYFSNAVRIAETRRNAFLHAIRVDKNLAGPFLVYQD